jgi:subfamily B ATP-binding cassette protein MsbA
VKTYFKILAFARPLRNFIPRYVLLAVLGIVFGIFNFSLLIPLLNIIFGTVEVPAQLESPVFSWNINYLKDFFNFHFYNIFLTKGQAAALQFVCGIVVVSFFFSNVFRYWSQRVLTGLRTLVVKNIRQALFNRLVSLNVRYFHGQRKGDLISVVSNDVTEIENSVVSTLQVIFREPLMLLGYVILLFVISVKLTLFSFLVLPVSAFIISSISRRLKKDSKKGQELLGNILSIIEETIGGIRIIKAFNAQESVKNKFEKQNHAYRQTLKAIWNRKELASPLSEFLGVSMIVGIILYGGMLVLKGESELSGSAFITYIILYSQVLAPAKSITSAVTNIQRGLAAAERVFDILQTDNPIQEAKEPIPLKEFKSSLEYKQVSFSYGQEKVLKNINLQIRKGQVIALVGPSGSGKSTLADLVPRFLDPTEGELLLDGISLRKANISDLRNLMGIVTQESILFNDSVTANIAFGDATPDMDKVKEAARVANADVFIEQLENGYETFIGDRGSRLSGGQRQRLSIARAVYKNPPILILDEATSALDTESEKLVQEALTQLMTNRTTLVIAHRLSTIQHADQILFLQDGVIEEQGTHDELMAQQGNYYRLIQLQQF